MKYIYSYLFLFFCSVLATSVYSQSSTSNFQYVEASNKPKGFFRKIIQDQEGFLWGATSNGLGRFDGYEFVNFIHDRADSTSISGNNIYNIFEDSRGRLWISTYTNGLNLFNKESETFTKFFSREDDPTSLISDAVSYIYEDYLGIIWVGTGEGLCRMEKEEGVFKTYLPNPEDAFSISNESILFIAEDQNNNLWIADRKGWNKYDRSKDRFINYKTDSLFTQLNNKHSTYSFTQSPDKTIWYLDTDNSLHYLEEKSGSNIKAPNSNFGQFGLDQTIYADQFGDIWYKSSNKNLHSYNIKNENYSIYDYNSVGGIGEDIFGNIWITNKGNLYKKDNGIKEFYNNNQWIGGNDDSRKAASCIYESEKQMLLIGNRTGLSVLDRTTQESFFIPYQAKSKNSFNNNYLLSVTQDRAGTTWVGTGTYGGKLHKVDIDNRNIEQITIDTSNNKTPLYFIHPDKKKDHILWLATYDALYKFNTVTKQKEGVFLKDTLLYKSALITHIVQEEDTLWLASRINGLIKFDINKEAFKHYSYNRTNYNSLPSNRINGIYIDHQGTLWLATPVGLVQFDRSTEEAICYNEKNGLTDNVVVSVLGDGKDYLWLGTLNGLAQFNIKNKSLKTYDYYDGIQGAVFSIRSFFKNKKGELFFGGKDGYNNFFPNQLKSDSTRPKIVLTDFKVLNKPYALPQALAHTSEIKLSHKDYFFEFQFAALHYGDASKNQYAYKLDGFDKDWVYIGNQRKAVYTNLSPGNYTFRVKASNHDEVWNEKGLGIKLYITPPIWQRPWFYALCILSGMILIYFILRNIQHRRFLKQQKEIAEQAAKYKSQFLANMSHEIRTPLNAIYGISSLFKTTTLTNKQERYTQLIEQASNDLMIIVDDILDHEKIQSGKYSFTKKPFDLEQVLQQVYQTFEQKIKQKQLIFKNNKPLSTPRYLLGDKTRLNQILSNIIGNAIKFTPEKGQITIKIKLESMHDNHIELLFNVSDNGIGIEKEKQEYIFGQYQQANFERDQQYGGTGLGLSICKHLVEQQGGQIWVESILNKGSTFYFKLPFEQCNEQEIGTTNKKIYPIRHQERFHFLLVEDILFNQLIAQELLQKSYPNCEITIADNGQIALREIQKHNFDLIFMDIRMPIMGGYETSSLIRKLPDRKKMQTPIIGLTSDVTKERIDKCYEAGMNAIVTKPIQEDLLVEKINQQLDIPK